MAEQRLHRAAQVARYTGLALTVIASLWINLQSSFAQDEPQNQTERDKEEVLDLFNRNPATAMDTALLGLRQTEIVTFLSNKPSIFKRGTFNHLEVSYDSNIHEIFVEVSYRSATAEMSSIVEDCKDSLNLAISQLVRTVPDDVAELVGSDNQRSLECKADSYFLGESDPRIKRLQITSPGWSICNSIRVVVTVIHDNSGATCRKDLTDKEIVVIPH